MSIALSDAWNEPESYNLVIPLTRVTGGEIWIEDPEGTAQCSNHDCNLPGKILELPASFQISINEALHRLWPSLPGVGEVSLSRPALTEIAGFQNCLVA